MGTNTSRGTSVCSVFFLITRLFLLEFIRSMRSLMCSGSCFSGGLHSGSRCGRITKTRSFPGWPLHNNQILNLVVLRIHLWNPQRFCECEVSVLDHLFITQLFNNGFFFFYTQTPVRDKLDPVIFSVNMSLQNPNSKARRSLQNLDAFPVLSQEQKLVHKAEVQTLPIQTSKTLSFEW